MSQDKQFFTMLGISLIVVRNHEGKWLAINETKNPGWWLPGGRVDPPEDFFTAAKRECKEEAGIDVELKGILRIEHNVQGKGYIRLKVVFYAEPIEKEPKLKDKPDSESLEARWVTGDELLELDKKGVGWRGPELYNWATYIENKGVIWPLSILDEEGSDIKLSKIEDFDKKKAEGEKVEAANE